MDGGDERPGFGRLSTKPWRRVSVVAMRADVSQEPDAGPLDVLVASAGVSTTLAERLDIVEGNRTGVCCGCRIRSGGLAAGRVPGELHTGRWLTRLNGTVIARNASDVAIPVLPGGGAILLLVARQRYLVGWSWVIDGGWEDLGGVLGKAVVLRRRALSDGASPLVRVVAVFDKAAMRARWRRRSAGGRTWKLGLVFGGDVGHRGGPGEVGLTVGFGWWFGLVDQGFGGFQGWISVGSGLGVGSGSGLGGGCGAVGGAGQGVGVASGSLSFIDRDRVSGSDRREGV